MKTISDMIFFCTEAGYCETEIFDLSSGELVYKGVLSEVPVEYRELKVCSFDPVSEDYPKLGLNIMTEDY